MNYMEQVAQMLGVELEEEFSLHTAGGTLGTYRLDEFGMSWRQGEESDWETAYWMNEILSGTAEIIKKPWMPKTGETYFLWNTVNNECFVDYDVWSDYGDDVIAYRFGNCYRTKEEAEADKEKWEKFFSCTDRIEWEDKK